jgi:hypothetical protein
MKQMIRYLLFVGLPFLTLGGFVFMVGIMHGQETFQLRTFDFGDTINLLVGGTPAALIGAFIERITRKEKELLNEPKL